MGILGFSQGAAVAATIASILEKDRGLWRKIKHPAVNFFIAVSGFRWDFKKYDVLYPISTPSLHVMGTAVIPPILLPFLPAQVCLYTPGLSWLLGVRVDLRWCESEELMVGFGGE